MGRGVLWLWAAIPLLVGVYLPTVEEFRAARVQALARAQEHARVQEYARASTQRQPGFHRKQTTPTRRPPKCPIVQ